MDLSESAQLIAQAAAQAGAMFSAAANTASRSTCRFRVVKTPPPALKIISTLDMSKHDAYHKRRQLYKKLCHGNTEAAELYEQILFVYQQKNGKPRLENIRRGVYWWGCPITKWAKRMGWTERQVKYRFQLLKDYELVETMSSKTPYNMLQARALIAEGAASLPGWPNHVGSTSYSDAESLTGQGSRGNNCLLAEGQKLSFGSETKIVLLKDLDGVVDGVVEKSNKKPANQKTLPPQPNLHQRKTAAAKSLTLLLTKDEVKENKTQTSFSVVMKNNGNIENGNKEKIEKVENQNQPQPLPSPTVSAPGKIIKAPKRKLKIAVLWQEARARDYPGSNGADLTVTNCRRLKNINVKLFAARVDAAEFINWIAAEKAWHSARCALRDGSKKNTLSYPNIPELERHLSFYLDAYRQQSFAAEKSAAQQAHLKAPMAPAPKPPVLPKAAKAKPVTPEELEAVLAKFKTKPAEPAKQNSLAAAASETSSAPNSLQSIARPDLFEESEPQRYLFNLQWTAQHLAGASHVAHH